MNVNTALRRIELLHDQKEGKLRDDENVKRWSESQGLPLACWCVMSVGFMHQLNEETEYLRSVTVTYCCCYPGEANTILFSKPDRSVISPFFLSFFLFFPQKKKIKYYF